MVFKILVTGIGGNVGQGIVRNIRSSFPDIRIVGTDVVDFTAGNHLCDKTYKVPYAVSNEYISSIKNIVENESIDLVIPSTDYEVYVLALHKDQLSTVSAVSDAVVAKTYLDKYQSFQQHRKHNIPFVETWLADEFISYDGDIIAKPRQGRGSRGILINPPNPTKLGLDYVIQPLIKGTEITSAVYATKTQKLHGTLTMVRELSNGATSKSKVVFEHDNAINNIAKQMIEVGGLYGSFNIQSIVAEDGSIHPFEINCRISGTNSIRHNFGFKDVVYTVQEYLFGIAPDVPNPTYGIATRILMDVIYPNAIDETLLNNNTETHRVY